MAINLRLVTRIDNSKAKKDAKEFEKVVDNSSRKASESGKDVSLDIDVKKAKKEIQSLEKEIDEYQAKLDKVKGSDRAWLYESNFRLERNIRNSKLKQAKTPEQKELIQAKYDERISQLKNNFNDVVSKVKEYKQKISENKAKVQQLRTEIESVEKAEMQATAVAEDMEKSVEKTQSLFKKLTNSLKSRFSDKLKNASSQIKSIGKHTDSLRKKMMKIGLALIGMRGLMAGLRQIVSSALNNNEALQKQLTAVKGVLGQALEPAINILVQGLSQMISFADRLYQVFTGTSLVAKYNAQQMKKAADATSDAADSAADYNTQMAGFDVANKLSDNSSNNSNSNQESASLFETVNLDNWLSSLIDKIKNNDWFGAGAGIAEKLVGGMKSVNWDVINTKLQNSAEKLADFINGFLTFKDNDGTSFGMGLATTLSNGIKTALDMLTTFVQTLDWGALADTLWDFVTNIDYSGLVNKAFSLIGSAFGGAASFIATLADNVIQSFRDYFEPFVDDAGGDIIEGVFNGIVEWLKNVKTWLKENVWDPFIDGFKSTFDIHSPSKDPTIHEMGANIIEGVFNGIVEWLKDINSWFKTNVFDKITYAWGNIKDLTLTIKGKLGEGWTNAKNNWESIKASGKSALATIKGKIQNDFNKAKKTWDAVKNKNPLATIKGKTHSSFTNAKKNWDNLKSKTTEVTTKLKDGITSGIKSILTSLCNMVNKVIGVLNKIPGVNISTITPPKLAKGAIVNNPGRGTTVTAGEAGPEGIIPLNEATLSKLGAMIAKFSGNGNKGQIIIPIYLNGHRIAKEIIDLNKRNDFETNLGGAY